MTRLLLAAAALAAVLAMATMGGDSNYAAERTAQVQAQQAAQTERTALTEANHTERTAISASLLQWQMAQEAQTMRLAMLLFVGVIVAGMTTVVIVVALRRPAQAATLLPGEIPYPSAALLKMWKAYPQHQMQYNDDAQEWMLVDAAGTYMLESDLVRQPRRIAQR